MANEKKNGTLEEIIVEMLKEGKAVRIPLKDVVDKMQENVKAAEDAQEAVQPETEKSEAVPQGGQVKTVPINIHIDNLHIHMDERMTSYNNFEGDSDETDEPDEDEPEDIDVDAMIGLIKARTGLCEKVILAVLAAQEEYLDSIWGENMDEVDKLQENVKAAEDVQEAVQPETEKSEAVPQGGQVKTVPINIHIDNLHIHMDERMTSYNNFEGDSDETDEPDEDEPEDIDVDVMIGLIKAKTGLCEKVILTVLAAQEEYLDSIWGENMDEEDKA